MNYFFSRISISVSDYHRRSTLLAAEHRSWWCCGFCSRRPTILSYCCNLKSRCWSRGSLSMQQVVKIKSAGKGNNQRKRKIEEAASKRANDTTRGKVWYMPRPSPVALRAPVPSFICVPLLLEIFIACKKVAPHRPFPKPIFERPFALWSLFANLRAWFLGVLVNSKNEHRGAPQIASPWKWP